MMDNEMMNNIAEEFFESLFWHDMEFLVCKNEEEGIYTEIRSIYHKGDHEEEILVKIPLDEMYWDDFDGIDDKEFMIDHIKDEYLSNI